MVIDVFHGPHVTFYLHLHLCTPAFSRSKHIHPSLGWEDEGQSPSATWYKWTARIPACQLSWYTCKICTVFKLGICPFLAHKPQAVECSVALPILCLWLSLPPQPIRCWLRPMTLALFTGRCLQGTLRLVHLGLCRSLSGLLVPPVPK